MLINISNKVLDEERLQKDMNDFEIVHEQQAYLFMNESTAKQLAYLCDSSLDPKLTANPFKTKFRGYVQGERGTLGGYIFGMYQGRKIYINEGLKFGEVDIR